jgi:ABC-2 type transport system ATP-binding protein
MTDLNLEHINFSYGNEVIINQLSHQFQAGVVYGILGINGSGKTTLYNLINGNIKPNAGKITYGQDNIAKDHSYFLETSNYFYPYITGREHLNLLDTGDPIIPFETLNYLLNIPLDQLIESYSTGMKKKLSIMTMLLYNRPIYLLDEPFNGLDMETNKILETLIKLIAEKNKIVLVTSHILQPLLYICEEVILLQNHEGIVFSKDRFDEIEPLLFGNLDEKIRQLMS